MYKPACADEVNAISYIKAHDDEELIPNHLLVMKDSCVKINLQREREDCQYLDDQRMTA